MIKLLPTQIPQFWELIKFVIVNLAEISNLELPIYINKVLFLLLNGKGQCWIKYDDNHIVTNLHLTKLVIDTFTGEKRLELCGTYAFKFTENVIWNEMINVINDFAKKENCSIICGESKNKRVLDMVYNYGFKEKSVSFYKKIGE